MNDVVVAFLILGVAAALIDQIPTRNIDWGDQAASQDDVAKIVAGKKRQGPRHLLKLTLLLIVALVLWRLVA